MQHDLESQREASKQQEFKSVKGISSFKVILFSPDSPLQAAPRNCLYNMCKEKCGSCSIFENFELTVKSL